MWNAIQKSARKLGDGAANEASKTKLKAVREIPSASENVPSFSFNRASCSPISVLHDTLSSLLS